MLWFDLLFTRLCDASKPSFHFLIAGVHSTRTPLSFHPNMKCSLWSIFEVISALSVRIIFNFRKVLDYLRLMRCLFLHNGGDLIKKAVESSKIYLLKWLFTVKVT